MQGFPKNEMFNYESSDNGTLSKLWAIGISMEQLNPEIVKRYQDATKLTWSYCPDDLEQVKYSIECGVTLITSNNPVPAIEYLKEVEKLEECLNN